MTMRWCERRSNVRQPDLPRLLDCMAVNSALDGMLVQGASAATLEYLATGLAQRMRIVSKWDTDQVWLGSAETEDALWGVPGMPAGWNTEGLLTPPGQTRRIVIVPDLSRLSLAAARAGVTTLGAKWVDVERRGQSQRFAMQLRWIAAVADEDVGNVSAHLLDRFAIRVRFTAEPMRDRRAWLQRQLEGEGAARHESDLTHLSTIDWQLKRSVSKAALQRAMVLTDSIAGSMRAPLALLRLAAAHARLLGADVIEVNAVNAAAKLLGRVVPRTADTVAEPELPHVQGDQADPGATGPASQVQPESGPLTEVDHGTGDEVLDDSGDSDALVATDESSATVQAPAEPPPAEPGAPPREYASLRLPFQQVRVAAAGRGAITGTRRSDTLQDLAVTETLFAAAPFQAWRRKQLDRNSGGIILRRPDLRSYRRAPPAGQLFVLVLDYTSVAGRQWLGALVPYLAEAYSTRAELCVVRVGAASAKNPLRADSVVARNVLVPSVAAALDEPAGHATPLADGLSLALRTLRNTLGHGRATTRQATLVVVTDGRGNVSLDASREGRWTGRVGRRGIDDARHVAQHLRGIAHLQRVLINPGPAELRDLPLSLAAALGALVVPLERADA